MIVEILARRYAKAFVNTLASPAEFSAAMADLKRVDSLIAEHKDLRDALFHPSLPNQKKSDVLRSVLSLLKISAKAESFCLAVVQRGRIIIIREIVAAVEKEWERRRRIVEVEIRSAIPLKSAQRERLEAELARITSSMLKPIYKLDSSVMAGVVARIGTTYYDGSLKGQLERIRQTLTES
ncbi:MAG: ATP synthase F1 subunit delta [Acidobacteriota bacterium]